MATIAPVTANSLQGQVDQLTKSFASVRKLGLQFEGQEQRTRISLFAALNEVYAFGEDIYAIKPAEGTSLFREFFEAISSSSKIAVPYNKKCSENPYIGLVKLAFAGSGTSSQSQYATVLHYAHTEKVKKADFQVWIEEKDDDGKSGIERRRDEAVEAKGSVQRQIRDQARTAQLNSAITSLMAKPASAPVALPHGIQAPQGFALVLAKIDGGNNASIVEVVETDAQKVDPVLLRLVEPQAAVRSDEPLQPMFQAIDLIINCTPDKVDGRPRDLLIRNSDNHGRPRAWVQAISEAYSFPGATMDIEGHIDDLVVEVPYLLRSDDARRLLGLLNSHKGWTLDGTGLLSAEKLDTPIQLEQLEDAGSYRVAVPGKNDNKGLKFTHDDFANVFRYIEQQRAAYAGLKKPGKRPFPATMNLEVTNERLIGSLPEKLLPSLSVSLASTSAETELDERLLAVSDIEAVAGTMKLYGADADGWLLDVAEGVDNAAVVVEAFVGNDRLHIVLPTKTGSSYNQVCEALVL